MKKNSTLAKHSSLIEILFGALIGILLGIAGVLIYQGYLGQVTNILLYVSLVFFGVVVLTFILVWGFKTYLTRLIFGSKVANSPDLIAEAQQMTDQLSSNVIDKLLEKATEEDKEKVKGLVVRLGNWFLWGRLRNWWWSWILGIFVSLGGLTGTLLLVNQNELLQNQNQLIKNQMSLEEASRRGALVMLMSNIFDKVDREIERQRDTMKVVTDSTKFSLSQSLIGQIAALSQAFKPYRFMDGDTLIGRSLSPERGQLLVTICGLPLDTVTIRRILSKTSFERADLKQANLVEAYLPGVNLNEANLEEANFTSANLTRAILAHANLNMAGLDSANLALSILAGADLIEAHLFGANLRSTSLGGAIMKKSVLGGANLSQASLEGANLEEAYLVKVNLKEAINLKYANFKGGDLSRSDLEGTDISYQQLKVVGSLYRSKLPGGIDTAKLRKSHPMLFKKPFNPVWFKE